MSIRGAVLDEGTASHEPQGGGASRRDALSPGDKINQIRGPSTNRCTTSANGILARLVQGTTVAVIRRTLAATKFKKFRTGERLRSVTRPTANINTERSFAGTQKRSPQARYLLEVVLASDIFIARHANALIGTKNNDGPADSAQRLTRDKFYNGANAFNDHRYVNFNGTIVCGICASLECDRFRKAKKKDSLLPIGDGGKQKVRILTKKWAHDGTRTRTHVSMSERLDPIYKDKEGTSHQARLLGTHARPLYTSVRFFYISSAIGPCARNRMGAIVSECSIYLDRYSLFHGIKTRGWIDVGRRPAGLVRLELVSRPAGLVRLHPPSLNYTKSYDTSRICITQKFMALVRTAQFGTSVGMFTFLNTLQSSKKTLEVAARVARADP